MACKYSELTNCSDLVLMSWRRYFISFCLLAVIAVSSCRKSEYDCFKTVKLSLDIENHLRDTIRVGEHIPIEIWYRQELKNLETDQWEQPPGYVPKPGLVVRHLWEGRFTGLMNGELANQHFSTDYILGNDLPQGEFNDELDDPITVIDLNSYRGSWIKVHLTALQPGSYFCYWRDYNRSAEKTFEIIWGDKVCQKEVDLFINDAGEANLELLAFPSDVQSRQPELRSKHAITFFHVR